MKKFFYIILIPILAVVFTGCRETHTSKPLKIAISKAIPEDKYQNYYRWIHSVDSTIICFDLYYLNMDSALKTLEYCDGLLLTGGPDIHPQKFGKERDTARCQDIDLKRDSLEFALLAKAMNLKMPVQGVCRGLQVINVYFGGSLTIDIPSDLGSLVGHQLPDTYECYHEVNVLPNSALFKLSGSEIGTVNSNHHQGIESLAPLLTGMAKTKDGLIEAIGLRDTVDKSYLLAVQWHPERLDYSNPLSGPVIKRFIEAVRTYSNSGK
jgi:putative glutamine amidotransferase